MYLSEIIRLYCLEYGKEAGKESGNEVCIVHMLRRIISSLRKRGPSKLHSTSVRSEDLQKHIEQLCTVLLFKGLQNVLYFKRGLLY